MKNFRVEPRLSDSRELDLITNSYADIINGLHEHWNPHDDQWPVVEAVFIDLVNSIFIRCGRKWGKTEIALYILWRIAKQYPGSPCYYFTPLQNQARNILWEDPRIKTFGPREWLVDGSRGISESDMVLRFKNGSFIKIDGTDNYNKYLGVRYKVAVYDEYKTSDPRMRQGMRPNASVLGGIDVYMGSPPKVSGTDYEALDKEHQSDPSMRAFFAPTWRNPHISKVWLKREKELLYRRGEGDVWEREYGAKYVRGGAASIFPMLDEKMVIPHNELMKKLFRDRKKLHWFWWADPAGATCFGVLFCAINPYTKDVYWLDEIYEKDQRRMTTKVIGRETLDKANDLDPRVKWRSGYDEAASWFRNEWIDAFPDEECPEPSQKSKNKKLDGITLIKDIMLAGKWWMSDRCVNFYKELENCIKDKNGKIPKVDDHLIDDARYILGAAYYKIKTEAEYREEMDEDFRAERLEDAFTDKDDYEEF